jgi:hypothetical protein
MEILSYSTFADLNLCLGVGDGKTQFRGGNLFLSIQITDDFYSIILAGNIALRIFNSHVDIEIRDFGNIKWELFCISPSSKVISSLVDATSQNRKRVRNSGFYSNQSSIIK